VPTEEVLILAMTKMLSGICTAGFSCERAPTTGLCWIRPVREFDTLLLGDMCDATGHLVQCCDVVELALVKPRPDPPHTEDWLVDVIHHRPRVVRRLEGQKRAEFFPKYLDTAPEDVLTHHRRSLCLVQPDHISVRFSLDAHTGRYDARMKLTLPGGVEPARARGLQGLSITDLKFRALGRAWLGAQGGTLDLTQEALAERLSAEAIYLTMGLSRSWQGEYWPLVHAVHVVPDYAADVQMECL
jgi:hypothetical protein